MLDYEVKDKRKSERAKVGAHIPVHIFYRRRRMCKGCVVNISPNGAYIQLSSLAIPLGAVIQAIFVTRNGNVHKIIRKSAIITRVGEDGCGVGFLNSKRMEKMPTLS